MILSGAGRGERPFDDADPLRVRRHQRGPIDAARLIQQRPRLVMIPPLDRCPCRVEQDRRLRLGACRLDIPQRLLKVPGRLLRPAEQDVAFADEGSKADRVEERHGWLLALRSGERGLAGGKCRFSLAQPAEPCKATALDGEDPCCQPPTQPAFGATARFLTGRQDAGVVVGERGDSVARGGEVDREARVLGLLGGGDADVKVIVGERRSVGVEREPALLKFFKECYSSGLDALARAVTVSG